MFRDKLDKLAQAVGRRSFLEKAASAAAALALGLLPKVAKAGAPPYYCCGLCVDPTTCRCSVGAGYCTWSWTCQEDLCRYTCGECYAGNPCNPDGTCNSQNYCSFSHRISPCPL